LILSFLQIIQIVYFLGLCFISNHPCFENLLIVDFKLFIFIKWVFLILLDWLELLLKYIPFTISKIPFFFLLESNSFSLKFYLNLVFYLFIMWTINQIFIYQFFLSFILYILTYIRLSFTIWSIITLIIKNLLNLFSYFFLWYRSFSNFLYYYNIWI
jgi:hypothetical protein